MSDTNETNQGVFRGPDGKLSGRRIIGTAFLTIGGGLLIASQFQDGDWTRVLPGVISATIGAFFWGMVTVQNIQDVLKK